MTDFKGCHFPKDVMLMAIRWYISYLLTYKHVEELLEEREIEHDHATLDSQVFSDPRI